MYIIGFWLGLAMLAACNKSVEPVERPCQELEEIDTLMWQNPDSALKVMMEFTESGRADSLDEFDGHYCQLLISELLYKNHHEQTNRRELLKAVGYFDSIDNGFLSARAHYINGVGYYEQDSVVEACPEYLKALEVVEAHFPNVETQDFAALQPKHLPRFMTLTYSRIGELFSSQFMQEPAIACFKESLAFDNIEPCSPNNRSCLLLFIGKQYYKLSQCDTAEYYFDEALRQLPDTNNAVFRELVSYKALFDYDVRHHIEAPVNDLKRMITKAADENELLARYTTLGAIYSNEGQYDSALFYLTSVFENNNDVVRQRAVSTYLRTVYQNLGDSLKATHYAVFITDNQRSEGESNAQVSILNDLFQQHLQWKLDRAKEVERQRAIRHSRWIWMAIAGLLLLVAIAIVVARRGFGKRLKLQQEESDKQLKIQQEESSKQLEAARDALKAKEQDALLTKVTAIYHDKLGNKAKRIFEAFNEAHPDAVAKLKTSYPDLTDMEVDICILSHFAFRVKEMADILDLRENTVSKYRSSIKKKAQIRDVESMMNQVL
jgi:tetratricopeptide (TPR) repeat protein